MTSSARGLGLIAVLALVACGGRVNLYQNVPRPDGGAGAGGAGAAGAGDLTAVKPSRGCGHDLPPQQQLGRPGSPIGRNFALLIGRRRP